MNDLAFGLQITVWGMGLVFGLLALLWALLSLVGRLEARAAAVPTSPPSPLSAAERGGRTQRGGGAVGDAPPAVRIHGPGASELAPEAVAAITAAVLAHSASRRRQAAPETRSYLPGSLLFASRWVAAGRIRQNRGFRRERS